MTNASDAIEKATEPVGLLGVGVANFQVIREFTWIPFGPLTLVFGPNSAGKSLIVDALDIAAQIWRGTSKDFDPRYAEYSPPEYETLLLKSKRREHGPIPDIPPVIEVAARVFTSSATELEPLVSELFPGFAAYLRKLETAEIRGRIERFEDAEFRDPHDLMELSLDGEPIYRSRDGEHRYVAINFRHAGFQTYEEEAYEFEADCSEAKSVFDVQDGWIKLRDVELDRHDRLSINAIYWARHDWVERLVKFKVLHDCLRVGLGGRLGEQASAARVRASRTVPTPQQLTFVLGKFETSVFPPPVESPGDPTFKLLAQGLLHRALEKEDLSPSMTVPTYQLPLGYGAVSAYEVSDYVNYALRNHLLIDNGYQLVADVSILVSLAEIKRTKFKLKPKELGYHHLIVRVKVRDQYGRNFDLSEIGSGVGYVLPILVAAARSGTTVVEQPELHLHPALQSALGDVLVELAISGKRRLIVETHSEHLMLRILRRIRDSTRGHLLDGRNPVSPSDVEVVYFDPQPDGATIVRRLRITPDGEFFERWPRGFFEERDKDLFDE